MQEFLPQSGSIKTEDELDLMSPSVLSFIGDGVQTLYVRVKLATSTTAKTESLHRQTSSFVSAVAQAQALKKIQNILTEKELGVFKRCRNCKTNTHAKNASIGDYRIASGLEGLIGYLYLSGATARLGELLEIAYKD